MEIPPTFPGVIGTTITTMLTVTAAIAFFIETTPETRVRYSKFSRVANAKVGTPTWPSRVSMMVIYSPAFILSILLLFLGLEKDSGHSVFMNKLPIAIPSPSLANVLCIIHFAKRCLEVLCIHSYSGRTDRATPLILSVLYMIIVLLFVYGGSQVNPLILPAPGRMTVGTALFFVGILGNLYHHYLLAVLRSRSSTSENKKEKNEKYVAPRGGLFSYVAAPHYLFEVIGWFGLAMVSGHLDSYLVVAGMMSYLSGRSVAQNEFNRKKFDENAWPRSRKNIIPFVF